MKFKLDVHGAHKYTGGIFIPEKTQTLGVVETDNGEKGALIYFINSGRFMIGNTQVLKSLDTQEVIKTLNANHTERIF